MFTISKKIREYDNYISYKLMHSSNKLVGYQNFNEEHFNNIRHIVNPSKLNTRVNDWDGNIGDIKLQSIEYTFEATDQQVSDAGIMYLLDRSRKWATSTDVHSKIQTLN